MANSHITTIVYASLGGILPTLFWLWFWLKNDKENPEPAGLIFLSFVMGAAAVLIAIPAQKFVTAFGLNPNTQMMVWAGIEEVLKYGSVALIAFGSRYLDEPIDYPMYLIAGALGFAALENTFFLLQPLGAGETTLSLITGNLRFIGSTLLHALASGTLGIFLGLSFYEGWFMRKTYFLCGLISAIALHTVFNFFIMKDEGRSIWSALGFIWVAGVIVVLLLEKLRRMYKTQSTNNTYA